MAHNILERVQARYESREMPFGRVYQWRNARVALECECGEEATLTATSTVTACRRCGADLGAFVRDLREREARLPDGLAHPWFHDAEERGEQHRRDEAAHPEGSPRRYDDITRGPGHGSSAPSS